MDVFEDKSWVKLRRLDEKYKRSLDRFLNYAFVTCAVENKIACPCRVCANRNYAEKDIVKAHLTMHEMDADYQRCIWNSHEPKKGSQLDDISVATKKTIEDELAKLPEGSSERAKTEIFKSIMGEDKYGYVKTFGMGAKVPRSQKKRCALEEEQAKRLKSEEQIVKMQDKLDEAFGQIGELKSLLVKLCNHQGLTVEKENENHEENEEENRVGEFDSEDEELDEDEELEDLTLP